MSSILENDGLFGLENDDIDCDGLAMVVNDNCEFNFEGKLYRSYTDYVQAKRSRTDSIFAVSGIGEDRPWPKAGEGDDLAIPPLLPRRKSSRIARKVREDYNKGINLAEFVRSDKSFGILRGLSVNQTLYPPNSRMSDFKGRILIFVHNFVPTDDVSITPESFFTLGKSGKPNQTSWLMPFRVLGKCMHRYNPGQFIDVDAAVRSTVEQTILTNPMFFGGEKNWCNKGTGDLTSYTDLAQLTDPIGQIFHETFAPRLRQMVVTTVLFSLANTHGKDAGIGSMTIRISNFVVFHMEVSFEIIFTMPFNEIASCAHWMLVLHFYPENRQCQLMTLRKAHYSILGASRKRRIYGWKRSD